MGDSTRYQFNMKVLRRHDPAIEEIIQSASFVVLYSHDGEWTKTGIEGPMFLYRRSVNPPYGFFVLNRNGVENFSATLTPDDDLELTSNYIIYRASEDGDVVGIWIFEPDQRDSIGQQMLKLQTTPVNSSAPQHQPHLQPQPRPETQAQPPLFAPSSSQAGQSISLDALFGNSSQASASTGPMNSSKGLSLLDSIFKSASPNTTPASPAPTAPASSAPPYGGAEGLKAMLGLNGDQGKSSNVQQPSATPSGLDALFASQTLLTPAPAPVEKHTEGTKADLANGAGPSAADIVDASLQDRSRNGVTLPDALSRRDFVREILALIHTDKEFVDDLYHRYQTRAR